MNIFSAHKTFGDIRRLREIIGVLFDEGLDFLIDEWRLRYFLPFSARVRRRLSLTLPQKRLRLARPLPERVRDAFEQLGPTFIKLGQMLSMRPDLAGEDFAKEFRKLQRAARPFPFSEARQIVEAELKKPLEKIFKSFERKPIAAASLAQVHEAVLKGGQRVAVKIQRPRAREMVERDIHILFALAGFVEQHVSAAKKFAPTKIVKEFADWTMRELDFTVEGTNIDRFRHNFRQEAKVVIPQVFWDYTTPKILTTEFIDGIAIDDVKKIKRAGLNPEEVARVGIRAALKQFFIDGFFHGDPHPGNFFVLSDGKVLFYDFGIVGYLTDELRGELFALFVSYADKDTEGYVRHLMDLGRPEPGADIKSFQREVEVILDRVTYRPLERKGFAAAFYDVLLVALKHDIHFPADLVLLGKALVTLESVGLRLAPKFNLDAEIKPFVGEVIKEEFKPERLAQSLQSNVFDTYQFLKRLPEHTRALIAKFEEGEFAVKINLDELRDLTRELDRQNDVRVLAAVVVASVIGSAILLRLESVEYLWGLSLGKAGLAISIFLGIWLLVLIRRK